MYKFVFILILTSVSGIFLLSSCTDYERAGINPKPFNSPAGWERDPYGGRIRN